MEHVPLLWGHARVSRSGVNCAIRIPWIRFRSMEGKGKLRASKVQK